MTPLSQNVGDSSQRIGKDEKTIETGKKWSYTHL